MKIPDPQEDYEGYCFAMDVLHEAYPCSRCGGVGEVTGDDDIERTCLACDGTGLSPDAPVDNDEEYDE